MPLITHAIPSLLEGVSDQPDQIRRESQQEEQVNMWPSLVEGLRRRPSTDHISVLPGLQGARRTFVHTLELGAENKFLVVIAEGDLKVFDLEGQEQIVSFPDGKDYLTDGVDPNNVYRAISIADFTFITNKRRKTALTSNTSPEGPGDALITVKAGNFASDYTVRFRGNVVSNITTAEADVPNAATTIRANNIANQIFNDLDALPNVEVRRSANVVSIRDLLVSGPTEVQVEDSRNGGDLSVVTDNTLRFSDLPDRALEGKIVRINGAVGEGALPHYVTFERTDASGDLGAGIWKETVAPDIPFEWDKATMPHVLIFEGEEDGFTFRQGDWVDRKAGDRQTNPGPLFLGRSINGPLNLAGRLGFISGEDTDLSTVDDVFDFWNQSAIQTDDNDPLFYSPSTTEVSVMRNTASFQRGLIQISDQVIYRTEIDNLVSPSATPVLNPVGRYSALIDVKPAQSKSSIFVPFKRDNNNSGVLEIFDFSDLTTGEDDTTLHVPSLIDGEIRTVSAASVSDMLCVTTRDNSKELYLYNFQWQVSRNGRDKVQSAWWTATTPDNSSIVWAGFIGDILFLLLRYPNETVSLESMSFTKRFIDQGVGFEVFLDRKVDRTDCTVNFDNNAGTSTITLPYSPQRKKDFSVVAGEDLEFALTGNALEILEINGPNVVVEGNMTSKKFFAGANFTSKLQPSKPFLREENQAVTHGRLQIKNWRWDFGETIAMKNTVTVEGRAPREQTLDFTKRLAIGQLFSKPILRDGSEQIKVKAARDKYKLVLESIAHYPLKILSANWDGTFWTNLRSRV